MDALLAPQPPDTQNWWRAALCDTPATSTPRGLHVCAAELRDADAPLVAPLVVAPALEWLEVQMSPAGPCADDAAALKALVAASALRTLVLHDARSYHGASVAGAATRDAAALAAALGALTQLRALRLTGPLFGSSFCGDLALSLITLTALTALTVWFIGTVGSGGAPVDTGDVALLATQLPRLTALRRASFGALEVSQTTSAALLCGLAEAGSVEHLQLRAERVAPGCDVLDIDRPRALARLTKLCALELPSLPCAVGVGIHLPAILPALRDLRITCLGQPAPGRAGPGLVRRLAPTLGAMRLRALHWACGFMLPCSWSQLAASFGDLSALTELSFAGCEMKGGTAIVAAQLPKLTALRSLSFSRCSNLLAGGEDVVAFARGVSQLQSLWHLSLKGMALEPAGTVDAVAVAVGALKALRVLDLRSTEVNEKRVDELAEHWAELRSLEVVAVGDREGGVARRMGGWRGNQAHSQAPSSLGGDERLSQCAELDSWLRMWEPLQAL